MELTESLDFLIERPDQPNDERSREALIARLAQLHREICALQREQLAVLGELDRFSDWEGYGAHDAAHFASMELGTSYWHASRRVSAGVALDDLPRISQAFVRGDLSVDKVV